MFVASMLRPDVQGNGYKSSDVDMFFYGLNENQANQKVYFPSMRQTCSFMLLLFYIFFSFNSNQLFKQLEDIYELVKQNTQSPCEVIRTKHAVTIVNQFPYRHIQIVLRYDLIVRRCEMG